MDTRLGAFTADLRKHSSAEIYTDQATRWLYSTDASNYQIMPLAVVIPRHDDDVLATAEICLQLGLPMLPRGSGSSLAGQTVGEAVILDFSRYLDQVLRVDARRRVVLAQVGVTLGGLNQHLRPYGLMIGPDPASADRATLGGCLGNNATGAHSILYGNMADHVVSLRAILSDGQEHRLGPVPMQEVRRRWADGSADEGYLPQVVKFVQENMAIIDQDFPRYWRRAGGYNLDKVRAQIDQQFFNLAPLLVGSEGTLGLILEAEMNLVPLPRYTALAVIHYASHAAAFGAIPALLELRPAAIELIDNYLLNLTRTSPQWQKRLTFVAGAPAALLVVEVNGDEESEVRAHMGRLERHLQQIGHQQPVIELYDPAAQANVWAVRKAGLGLLMSLRGDAKPVPGIEDVAVPPDNLADYMAELHRIMDGRGILYAMYAHASAGCLHVRPILNLKTETGVQDLVTLVSEAATLARRYGGVLSSEHGEGLARSYFAEQVYGPAVYALFRQLKRIFDPQNLFNPGKIVDAPAPDRFLRYGPSYGTRPLVPQWHWDRDGSYAQAVEMCNGAGVCRKLHEGTMCPSFQATREEKQSTRGRANLLRGVLQGELARDWWNKDLVEALDLCLGCKACKSECPSSVDMTKLKAEAYAQRYRTQSPPLNAWAFANIDRISAWASPVAGLANASFVFSPSRWLVGKLLHLHPARKFPHFHRQTFSRRWRSLAKEGTRGGKPVVLFVDTFTEFNEPQQGLAAAKVLTAAGYEVFLAPRHCCGRPALSQGLVPQARSRAEKVVAALHPYAQQGIPVVGLEPSCLLTIRDDYPDLLGGAAPEEVAANTFLFDEFLAEAMSHDRSILSLKARSQRYLLHGHCHQKALTGLGSTMAVLANIPGARVEAIDAGCCGMAGAFGYTVDHYDVSMRIAHDRLVPALQAAPQAVIVADGVSCRHQIAETTGRGAIHLAEALATSLV